MDFQILKNFLTHKVRKGDIYVPSAIVLLLKNNGEATFEQLARLIYIFEYKHSVEEYLTIVKNFVSVILQEYSIAQIDGNKIILDIKSISKQEKNELLMLSYKVSNGFFKNLKSQEEVS